MKLNSQDYVIFCIFDIVLAFNVRYVPLFSISETEHPYLKQRMYKDIMLMMFLVRLSGPVYCYTVDIIFRQIH